MKRYLKLYLYFLQFSFSKAMHFRSDFFFRVVMDIVYYLIQFSFFDFLFAHTTLLGNWTLAQVRIFVAGYILVDAIHMTLFANNMWNFPFIINRGELDYYLTKPVSTLFFISFKEFAANSFLNVLIAIGIMIWTLTSYPDPISLFRIFIYLLLILSGTYLFYLVHLLFLIPVFWTQASKGFVDLFYTGQKILERPHHIFPSKLRLLFMTLIPFSIIASFPINVLFENNILRTILWCVIITLFFQVLVQWIWRKGLAAYSSASS